MNRARHGHLTSTSPLPAVLDALCTCPAPEIWGAVPRLDIEETEAIAERLAPHFGDNV
jgi:hypothetical protein